MKLQDRIQAFVQLGRTLSYFGKKQNWKDFNCGLNEDEFNQFNDLISRSYHFNGWFVEENVRQSIEAITLMLSEQKLLEWVKGYEDFQNSSTKKVAVIMAGNIPLVGFHDFLSVLISGKGIIVKLSSDDNKLLPHVFSILLKIEPRFKDKVEFDERFKNFDAIIATGSDNSARYFESYFSKYPHIIRKNRTSIALITGKETEDELANLAKDVFSYFGLGCRNVTKVLVPKNYDLNNLFKAFFPWKEITQNNKYANNYDYNKAVYLMNSLELIENGFLLLKEDENLHSPLAVLFYQYYNNTSEAQNYIEKNRDSIQCIVSNENVPFGKAQSPDLDDYADGVNTLNFLQSF